MIIKKSNKSIQNSLNDMKLSGDVDYTVTNSAYTQARAKLNYTHTSLHKYPKPTS